MRSPVERYHPYRVCPRCQNDVQGSHRFCRTCAYWLARPQQDEIRTIDGEAGAGRSWFFDPWMLLRSFQASLHVFVTGLIMGVGGLLLLMYLISEVMPCWLPIGERAQRRACYANNRVIRNALELYSQDNKFTRELASDPVQILWKAGYLQFPPQCPTKGNRYEYFFKSSVQNSSMPCGLICVGSQPHGLADE
ncbi:MAG TPA: hypothetical protein VIV61_15530 [Candidatus Ozemobacteraceae bacterium]